MSCSRMQSLLSSFIDDELGPRDTETLLLHLRACPSCREELEELRTLQQFHKRALAHKATPISSLAFTKKVMTAVQREDAETHPVDATTEVLPSWGWHVAWGAFAGGRRWIAASIAAAAAVVLVVLSPFSPPEQDLRSVSELKTTAAEVAAGPDDTIEHYLAEHTIGVAEARLAGWADSLQFVSYPK